MIPVIINNSPKMVGSAIIFKSENDIVMRSSSNRYEMDKKLGITVIKNKPNDLNGKERKNRCFLL